MIDFDVNSVATPGVTLTPPAWTASMHAQPPNWLAPEPSMPYWSRDALRAQLEALRGLHSNWDGFDAVAVSESAIDAAQLFVAGLTRLPAPFILPTPDGTLTLEWDSPLGEAILEVGRTRYSFYVSPKAGQPVYSQDSADSLPENTNALSSIVETMLFPAATPTGFYRISRVGNAVNVRFTG